MRKNEGRAKFTQKRRQMLAMVRSAVIGEAISQMRAARRSRRKTPSELAVEMALWRNRMTNWQATKCYRASNGKPTLEQLIQWATTPHWKQTMNRVA